MVVVDVAPIAPAVTAGSERVFSTSPIVAPRVVAMAPFSTDRGRREARAFEVVESEHVGAANTTAGLCTAGGNGAAGGSAASANSSWRPCSPAAVAATTITAAAACDSNEHRAAVDCCCTTTRPSDTQTTTATSDDNSAVATRARECDAEDSAATGA